LRSSDTGGITLAIKTPGSLGSLQIIEEEEYGTTPSATTEKWEYLGRIKSYNDTDDPGAETVPSDGARIYSDVLYTARDCKFNTELAIFRDDEEKEYTWVRLLDLTLGSSNGATSDIPSFSSVMRFATDQYKLANGCKIDSLSLSTKGVGKQVVANAGIICRSFKEQMETREALVGEDVDEPSCPTSPPLTYTSYPKCTIPDLNMIPSTSFDLKISNGLSAKEGFDDEGEALLAGSGIIPADNIKVELDLNIMSVSSTWDALKRNGTKKFDTVLTLNGYEITLKNCYLPGNDTPSRTQNDYDEPIKIIAADISYETIKNEATDTVEE
jgi:hypothetical protein